MRAFDNSTAAMERVKIVLLRSTAFLIDLWLSFFVSTIAVLLAWLLAYLGGPTLGITPIYNFTIPVVMFFYRTYYEARGRRTYAQRWMWLKVIDLKRASWGSAVIRNCYLLIMVVSAFGLPHVPEVVMSILLIFVVVSGRHPFDYAAQKAVIIAPPELDAA